MRGARRARKAQRRGSECYDLAAQARARAEASNDPALTAEYLRAEKRWLTLARSYGFSESLEDFTAVSSEWRRKLEERLEQSKTRLAKAGRNHDWPEDLLQLYEINTSLIQEGKLEALYDRVVDAAAKLMSSDIASMQMLDPERNQLRLLAWTGFHPQSADFWNGFLSIPPRPAGFHCPWAAAWSCRTLSAAIS